jgi:hypothetical protein
VAATIEYGHSIVGSEHSTEYAKVECDAISSVVAPHFNQIEGINTLAKPDSIPAIIRCRAVTARIIASVARDIDFTDINVRRRLG